MFGFVMWGIVKEMGLWEKGEGGVIESERKRFKVFVRDV